MIMVKHSISGSGLGTLEEASFAHSTSSSLILNDQEKVNVVTRELSCVFPVSNSLGIKTR